MADYTKLQLVIGAYLRIGEKFLSRREHARLADNANYDRRLPIVANALSTSDNEDAKCYGDLINYLDQTVVQDMQNQYQNFRSLLEGKSNLFGVIAAEISPSKEDADGGAIEYEYEDLLGVISIQKRKGMLGALYDQMVTDGYYVLANGVTNGGLTAQSGNAGTLTGTTLTFLSHTPTGTFVFECTDDTISAPKFKVSLRFDSTEVMGDGTDYLDADNELTLEKAFSDGPTGCSALVLTRSGLAAPTESNDNWALISGMAITNPQDGDLDDGKLYLTVYRITIGASSDWWLITFYNAAARLGENGVGSASVQGTTGTVAVSGTLANGTAVSFTFSKVNAHTNIPTTASPPDLDIEYDIDTPAIGDKWTLAVTNDHAGNYQTKMMKMRRFSFPVAGSTQFTDANASTISMS